MSPAKKVPATTQPFFMYLATTILVSSLFLVPPFLFSRFFCYFPRIFPARTNEKNLQCKLAVEKIQCAQEYKKEKSLSERREGTPLGLGVFMLGGRSYRMCPIRMHVDFFSSSRSSFFLFVPWLPFHLRIENHPNVSSSYAFACVVTIQN